MLYPRSKSCNGSVPLVVGRWSFVVGLGLSWLRDPPPKAFAQNHIWCAIVVALASDLLAWMGMLALTGHEARC